MSAASCPDCARWRAEAETAQEEVRQLRDALRGAPARFPRVWRLTLTERALLSAFMAREELTADQLMLVLEEPRGSTADVDRVRVVIVQISRLRKKLRAFGINIPDAHAAPARCSVWHLPAAEKQKIRAAIEAGP